MLDLRGLPVYNSILAKLFNNNFDQVFIEGKISSYSKILKHVLLSVGFGSLCWCIYGCLANSCGKFTDQLWCPW